MGVYGLEAAFNSLVEDWQDLATKAVKNAAKKVQEDIMKEAETYLQQYYSNYSPKIYKRSYNLKNAIKPFFADGSSSSGISIEVGVEYDSGPLTGVYKSNSWYHQSGGAWVSVGGGVNSYGKLTYAGQNNGIPEGDWILDNFLKGYHPWSQQDGDSTETLMEQFFDTELPSRIEQYVSEATTGAIMDALQMVVKING